LDFFMSAHPFVLLGPFWGPKQCVFIENTFPVGYHTPKTKVV